MSESKTAACSARVVFDSGDMNLNYLAFARVASDGAPALSSPAE
ncbi:MAG TPA: hypothetical protein VER04_26300 [Polyangiaceae bacterium]|nr:hypothetical protein [Polyangiaceae bacterium]